MRAVRRRDGKALAVKTLYEKGNQEFRREDAEAEMLIHMSLHHPKVVALEGVYESDESIHLVMEALEGGDLFDYLQRRGRLSEAEAAAILRELLGALAYLHREGVVHRDVKLENCVFAEPGQPSSLKLLDFGLAERLGPEALSEQLGTIWYMAPEVFSGSYDESADLWSLGILAYTLLCGHFPWRGTEDEARAAIVSGEGLFFSRSFRSRSPEVQHFVRSLLEPVPQKRLSAEQALQHPWLATSVALPHVLGPNVCAVVGRCIEAMGQHVSWVTMQRAVE